MDWFDVVPVALFVGTAIVLWKNNATVRRMEELDRRTEKFLRDARLIHDLHLAELDELASIALKGMAEGVPESIVLARMRVKIADCEGELERRLAEVDSDG